MIKHISFKHGWFYHYRVHTQNMQKSPKPVQKYLHDMFTECPHEHFIEHPRSSALRFDHDIALQHANNHEISAWARMSEAYKERYKAAHSRVEVFMLENDENTLAVEVPLWLHHHEAEFYKHLLNTEKPLSGHIDLLRQEGKHTVIWDYKPKAQKEKYAAIQVLFYAYMLAKRTQLPLETFKCGYFDEQDCYTFTPRAELFQAIEE